MDRRLREYRERIKKIPHPLRKVAGVLLILGGVVGFLPILGFWMIPLGLLMLSSDFPWARRAYLSIVVWMRRRRHRKQRIAEKGRN